MTPPAADSRRPLLEALKRAGPLGTRALAEKLRLTREAVRLQLAALEIEGVVERRDADPTGRAGRPGAAWALTELGEELFPKSYDGLAALLIEAVSAELGEDAVGRLLARITEMRMKPFAHLKKLPFDERLRALKDVYSEGDPYTAIERRGGAVRLVERSCPFLATAREHPALCSTTVSLLSRVLGRQVVREERFQDGDGRCVFLVTDTPAPRAFEPEPPRPAPAEK